MSDQYYYRNTNGQESGPYDTEECRRMVSVGLLEMNGMVRQADAESWQLVGSVFPSTAPEAQPPRLQTPGPSPAPVPTLGTQTGQPRCTRTVYVLLALLGAFFGFVGVHNLVAGYKERGFGQLALTALAWIMVIAGFLTGGVSACLSIPLIFGLIIWAVIEAITVKADVNNVPMS